MIPDYVRSRRFFEGFGVCIHLRSAWRFFFERSECESERGAFGLLDILPLFILIRFFLCYRESR